MSNFSPQTPEGAFATSIENARRQQKPPLGDLGVKEKRLRHYFISSTHLNPSHNTTKVLTTNNQS
jgi:hypothetical protein